MISCNAANNLLGIYSPFLPGNKLNAPVITQSAESVIPGGTVTFTASSNLANVAFNWSITEGEGAIEETGESVIFTAGSAPGSAVVSCYGTLEGYPDSESSTATVTVTEAPVLETPVISADDGLSTVFISSTAAFSASGSGSGVTYNWSVDGTGSIESTGTAVTYTAPSTEESVTISCYATADGFNDSATANLSIAVKANHYAFLTSTGTVSGSNLNQASAASLSWSSSSFNSDYFEHSTSVNPERLVVKQAGNYFVAVTVPMTSVLERSCVKAEVYVNGSAVPGTVGESSYIRNSDGNHNESSDHIAVLLNDLSVNDYIEVKVNRATSVTGTVSLSGKASLYTEHIEPAETIFSASATQTTAGTNLNQSSASPLEWTEKVKTSGFTHSDGTNPEAVILDEAGYYLVFVNIPLNTAISNRCNVLLSVQLNGVTVPGGEGKQGYIRGTSGHQNSSIHWSGMVYSAAAGGNLRITTQKETQTTEGTITTGSEEASLFIQKINASSLVLFTQATELMGGTNWNPAAKQNVKWSTDAIIDTNQFTHSTSSNPDQIIFNRDGDYLLIYNDSLQYSAPDGPYRYNPRIEVEIDGITASGAQTKCHYQRVDATTGNFESSGTLVYYLKDISAGETITVTSVQEADAATLLADQSALLILIRKQ